MRLIPREPADRPLPAAWRGEAQSVLDALASLSLVVDATGRVLATNEAWRQFQRTHPADMAPIGPGDDYVDHLRAQAATRRWAINALAGLTSVLAGRMGSFEMDYDVLLADIDRTFSLSIVPLPEGGALVSHVDITWRKSLERQLSHRATHDPVTGLPNRTLLTDRLTQALQRAARTGHRVAVMFCDLDQFKVINDTMGHVVGDRVVRTVARRLESACRTSDSVTRFGGDEFVIVAEDITSDDDARAVAERLREAATAPLEIDGVDLWFGMSMGVITTEGDVRSSSRDSDDLLRDADTAMYRAKDLGRNRVVLFDSSMRDDVASRLEVSMALRHAVERQELRLEFQPEFSCADGRVVGVEALVRWQHPQRGLLGPGEFIEAAEECGAIVEIGAWVLDEACREAAAWSRIAGPGFSVAVNLSSEQLAEPEFYDRVADCLRRHSLDPARLVLELTESALMRDPESVARMLHRLSDLGVWISVDDFGTGYSSLAYLQQFPVDVLKIDRSFVTRMVETPKGTALVHGIVDLAHALGLLTVAEGVEDEEQRRAVARAGCDAYQGYVSAMPVPADDVVELLRRQATADAVAG